MDCVWDNAVLRANLRNSKVVSDRDDIRNPDLSNNDFLNLLAVEALQPCHTLTIFAAFEPIFPDLCARWLFSDFPIAPTASQVLSAFARVLPSLPHVSILAEHLVPPWTARPRLRVHFDNVFLFISAQQNINLRDVPDGQLREMLLAQFRLLEFDYRTFVSAAAPSRLQQLFGHPKLEIRFLAIHVFCLLIKAADALTQNLILKHVGKGDIRGEWETRSINYRFMTLWEEKYARNLKSKVEEIHLSRLLYSGTGQYRHLTRSDISSSTAEICGVLLPRHGDTVCGSSTLVSVPTTDENRKALAEALRSSAPILVTGPPGCGKTSIINDVARELGTEESMLSLHVNEQTDAKMLIGMYTASSTNGSFSWCPGALSIAAQEGRWVLIEDLDRALADVIEVIVPLLSSRELTISSQGQNIRVASGFRLLATVRTTYNHAGQEQIPSMTNLSETLWNRVNFKMPGNQEFQHIMVSTFPILEHYFSPIIRIYDRARALLKQQRHIPRDVTEAGRAVTPRDLLRLCRRLDRLFRYSGLRTGSEPVPESMVTDMLAEAVDCFAGFHPAGTFREVCMKIVGEELRISPQQVDHRFQSYVPSYQNTNGELRVGRAHLPRRRKPDTLRGYQSSEQPRTFVATRQTLRLLEQVGSAVLSSEPVLLVGETGTGKTALIQHIAETLGHKLTVLNLSQQSESGDLLGSFKPVSVRSLIVPLKEDFEALFESTFSSKKNRRFVEMLEVCMVKEKWSRLVRLWKEALDMAYTTLGLTAVSHQHKEHPVTQPQKRRKTDAPSQDRLRARWNEFGTGIKLLEKQLSNEKKPFAFKFVEGSLVRAARNGDWILLDEINLAPSETLESLAGLLSDEPSSDRSLLLTEAGGAEKIRAHPDFRIFGAMNPSTDVGKRDLPPGLRSRFFELYVDGPDKDYNDLLQLLKIWLGQLNDKDTRVAADITQFYLAVKKIANENLLANSANENPHFSLRTLTRTVVYIVEFAPTYGIRRAMFESFSMSFLTHLDQASQKLLMPLIDKHIIGDGRSGKALMRQTPKFPDNGKQYVLLDRYWVPKGQFVIETQPDYIITPFVRRNLSNLILAMSTQQFPILIQGPTSSGKTSMISHLAKMTGNKCVRINNHEHTDLQEYIGAYSSDSEGQLFFQEGVLVRALREGHWIILDELNLASTDVLEALNRLLDDNRELMIPETQQVVKPHPNFLLFATQNPPGIYGGRKILSRAFRNRFVELHFGEIPESELGTILQERTKIAPSFCSRIVSVYKELLLLRQSERIFEHKNSFVTLRDLFRWASRKADNREEVAINGYMLLAERVRRSEEKVEVKRIIERIFSVVIDEERLYGTVGPSKNDSQSAMVWTHSMRRLFSLVSSALEHSEPILIVGETGGGKTSLCQSVASMSGKYIHIINAQQNTETGDLIGAQRPLRNRSAVESQLVQDLITVFTSHVQVDIPVKSDLGSLLDLYDTLCRTQILQVPSQLQERIDGNRIGSRALFDWSDGALVRAMKEGEFFLLDEISLADDSVLERLNSVLEPQRTILLAEKGPIDSMVAATPGFQFLATMNPGGDFGKKELSPALRNRFTEIWVPPLSEDDLLQIVEARLCSQRRDFAQAIVSFSRWFRENFNIHSHFTVSARDALAWVTFVNRATFLEPNSAYMHGAALVFVDTLGANPSAISSLTSHGLARERERCFRHLSNLMQIKYDPSYLEAPDLCFSPSRLVVGPFTLSTTSTSDSSQNIQFQTRTTKTNLMRIVRALQLQKPILIEGSPGVGKTSLVSALAETVGKPLTRINLSEQTDLMDLFGTDAPVEGAKAGAFAWRDGPFLQAMQNGEWVLLDELNLASQSVLEGLNSCFDHRGQIFLSELSQTFIRHTDFVVFATQNPYSQGAGRKGLPGSFVNRFSVVYADEYLEEDLLSICQSRYPQYSPLDLQRLLRFLQNLREGIRRREFGSQGGPWDFNLRDITRWLQLLTSPLPLLSAASATDFLNLAVSQRFRNEVDRVSVETLFAKHLDMPKRPICRSQSMGSTFLQIGLGLLARDELAQPVRAPGWSTPQDRLPVLESISLCIQQNWPCILVGPSGCGKASLVKYIASVTGRELVELNLNSNVDTTDFIGGYEQVDVWRHVREFVTNLKLYLQCEIRKAAAYDLPREALLILEDLQFFHQNQENLQRLHDSLTALKSEHPSTELLHHIEHCEQLLQMLTTPKEARFEWIDGTLIKALEHGAWVILRHANLCAPSVLDRLNSLLEPNGCLLVSEKQNTLKRSTVVKPHPNFRIFLTMDPQHGELSRAMRNRSIEIYITPSAETSKGKLNQFSTAALYDSSISRFRTLTVLCSTRHGDSCYSVFLQAAFRRLAIADQEYLASWGAEMLDGLQEFMEHERYEFKLILEKFLKVREIFNKAANLCTHRSAWKTVEKYFPGEFLTAQNIDFLHNEPLLQYTTTTAIKYGAPWIGFILDLILDIFTMLHRLDTLGQMPSGIIHPTKVYSKESSYSIRHRNERSRSGAFMEPFLRAVCEEILQWTTIIIWQSGQPNPVKDRLLKIIACWNMTFEVIAHAQPDPTMVQASVQLWNTTLCQQTNPDDPGRPLFEALETLLHKTKPSRQLESGLSMERLWLSFKPQTATKPQEFHTLMRLEKLAAKFDALAWRTHQPIENIVRLTESLTMVFRDVLTQNAEMEVPVKLEQALQTLEHVLDDFYAWGDPYFQFNFEALCQHHDISGQEQKRDDVLSQSQLDSVAYIFAKRSSKSTTLVDRTETSQSALSKIYASPASLLSTLVAYTGFGTTKLDRLLALRGQFQLSTLQKICHIKDVPLKMIGLLRLEASSLGKGLVRSTVELSQSQLLSVSAHLAKLVQAVFKAHSDICTEFQLSWIHALVGATDGFATNNVETLNSTFPHFDKRIRQHQPFQHVTETYLIPVLQILENFSKGTSNSRDLAIAWILFAIGCMILYVPNQRFDPFLRSYLESKVHSERRTSIISNYAGFKEVERYMTGQATNWKCETLETELQALGNVDYKQSVFRPKDSRLDSLQTDFDSVLSTLVTPFQDISTIQTLLSNGTGLQDRLDNLRLNIQQISRRLSENHREYDDLTSPLIGFLGCLELGLCLACLSGTDRGSTFTDLTQKTLLTPFLGARPQTSLGISAEAPDKVWDTSLETRIDYLEWMSILANVQGPEMLSDQERSKLVKIFQSLYEEWRRQLQVDQDKQAEKTGLYRYHGNAEDSLGADEEDLEKLFPTHDDKQQPKERLRSLTLRLATLHYSIFCGGSPAADLIIKLLEAQSMRAGELWKPSEASIEGSSMNEALIPGLIISTFRMVESLFSAVPKVEKYNLYKDSNIGQAEKLLNLVRNIHNRFSELQRIWPEHATLREVLVGCEELCLFKITDPLAKYLAKTEKVHAQIHEWQIVASREFSVDKLYADLTSLMINWRRLELQTWAQLFTFEEQNCEAEAQSWWFMAYELIIAVPMSAIDLGEGLQEVKAGLLSVLERFSATTTIGQFLFRLRMLTAFKQHARLIARDSPHMGAICTSLTNFLNFYKCFAPQIETALAEKKKVCEKEIKEVIVLASWKDTNVHELGEAARRSHRKLLAIVKRYRTQLAQPIQDILTRGISSSPLHGPSVISHQLIRIPDAEMREAFRSCQESIPGWKDKNYSWINAGFMTSSQETDWDHARISSSGAQLLDDFSSELTASIKVLQKETPPTLTEENKKILAYLKTRKRKLFAETLRSLRQMGFQYNLGADMLAAQSSLPIVFGRIQPFAILTGYEDLCKVDNSFHQLLDYIPKARLAPNKHSGDLTSAEVTRSVGYLEGILLVILQQREILARAISQEQSLRDVSETTGSLWNAKTLLVQPASAEPQTEHGGLKRCLLWLPVVLEVASRILQCHTQMAEIEVSGVEEGLRSWKASLVELLSRWKTLPRLPSGITTNEHRALELNTKSRLTDMKTDADRWTKQQPSLGYLFRQIDMWTQPVITPKKLQEPRGNETPQCGLLGFEERVSEVCNEMAAAIEKVQGLPRAGNISPRDSAWLMKYEENLAAAIEAMQAGWVTSKFRALLNMFRLFREEEIMTALALLALASSTLKRYRDVYNEGLRIYLGMHMSTCKTASVLASSFIQLAEQGYCGPTEGTDTQEGNLEKVENGTGLGEGEGAEDISKDIGDDESLPDTVTNKHNQGQELDNEKDAVQMADEMEGQDVDSISNTNDENDENADHDSAESELDERIDDISDGDAAVDDKIVDQQGNESGKGSHAENVHGKKSDNDQPQGVDADQVDEGASEAEEGSTSEIADEPEGFHDEDLQGQDLYTREGDMLDLPDNMDLDDKQSPDSDGLDSGSADEMSLLQEDEAEQLQSEQDSNTPAHGEASTEVNHDFDDEMEQQNASPHDVVEKGADEAARDISVADTSSGLPDLETADSGKTDGVEGADEQENSDQAQAASHHKAGDSSTKTGTDVAPSAEPAGEDLQTGMQNGQAPVGERQQQQSIRDKAQAEALKKLGDILKEWHHQSRQIREASERQANHDIPREQDLEAAELEHIGEGDDDDLDHQALGAATEEQAHAFDQASLSEIAMNQLMDSLPPELPADEQSLEEPDRIDTDKIDAHLGDSENSKGEDGSGALAVDQRTSDIYTSQLVRDTEGIQINQDDVQMTEDPPEPDLTVSDQQMARSASEAQILWTAYENDTRSLSLGLTEQLRLILNPTVASKMRGDFRTGKRLNIKRIIPYIASQYRRDKIWMRRSKPGKRNYQIMLAVDDSKSMAEGGAGDLALQSLVMISRSLSMLEAGQICIVAFGHDMRVAHAFDAPLSAAAGGEIFQNFSFQQTATNVRALLAQSIPLFRSARLQAVPSSSSNVDPWQLQLIISDGLCEDHGSIRRLVRQAQEERIMIIFIIVDNIAHANSGGGKGQSILEISQAIFETENVDDAASGGGGIKVRMQRYLDSFPFPYYLVVGDVTLLPGILATALRQWFKEVVDAGN